MFEKIGSYSSFNATLLEEPEIRRISEAEAMIMLLIASMAKILNFAIPNLFDLTSTANTCHIVSITSGS